MAAIPQSMFNRKRIRKMLQEYQDDPSVFKTETEYYLALYAKECWDRMDALKSWTYRYRLNTDSIVAFVKREKERPKCNRMNLEEWDLFMHKKILALHDCELGRREIMDIE